MILLAVFLKMCSLTKTSPFVTIVWIVLTHEQCIFHGFSPISCWWFDLPKAGKRNPSFCSFLIITLHQTWAGSVPDVWPYWPPCSDSRVQLVLVTLSLEFCGALPQGCVTPRINKAFPFQWGHWVTHRGLQLLPYHSSLTLFCAIESEEMKEPTVNKKGSPLSFTTGCE